MERIEQINIKLTKKRYVKWGKTRLETSRIGFRNWIFKATYPTSNQTWKSRHFPRLFCWTKAAENALHNLLFDTTKNRNLCFKFTCLFWKPICGRNVKLEKKSYRRLVHFFLLWWSSFSLFSSQGESVFEGIFFIFNLIKASSIFWLILSPNIFFSWIYQRHIHKTVQ